MNSDKEEKLRLIIQSAKEKLVKEKLMEEKFVKKEEPLNYEE
jgi:hypothetical protein